MKLNKIDFNNYKTYLTKLTGQIRLVIDSEELFIHSIDNGKLNSDKYKEYKININETYATNIKNYFKNIKNSLDIYSGETIFNEIEYSAFKNKHLYNTVISLQNVNQLPDIFVIFKCKKGLTTIHEKCQNGTILQTYNLVDNLKPFLLDSGISNVVYSKNVDKNNYNIFGYNYLSGRLNKYTVAYNDKSKSEGTISTEISELFSKNNLISSSYFNISYTFDSSVSVNIDEEIYGAYLHITDIISNINIDITKQHELQQISKNLSNIKSNIINLNEIYINNNIVLNNENLHFLKNIDTELCNIHIDDNIMKFNNIIDFSKIYGVIPNSKRVLKVTELTPEDYSNVIFTIKQTDNKSIFGDGDYISITSGNNKEWRLIANNNNCCYDDICENKSELFICDAKFDSLVEYDSCILLNFHIEGMINITEGDTIQVISNNGKKYNIELQYIAYDEKYNVTRIKILDYINIFDYSNDINYINISYNSPTYLYTYFNPTGDAEYVSHKISRAAEKFKNKLFTCIHQNNNLIFKDVTPYNANSNMIIKYNFTTSNTKAENFLINGFELSGKKYLTNSGNIILRRRRNNILFTGKSLRDKTLRLRIKKSISKDINLSEIAVETKFGIYEFEQYQIETNNTYVSNYVDDMNLINKYDVLTLITEHKDVLNMHNFFLIYVHKIFRPDIISCNTYEIVNI